ncbi:GNAT family N-acetyltransferase [Paeniroseomonas aquatica]|uniref:GNAT family N-acetyltransferase n=1 Tax=Paeniroseomonas aquatica TaxID=373043 RepID=A0ABT8A096_9PROT|nr:GNAT family N-acetyltransferase [Paeniroseomonas aquatica]MDN3563126.1 GNAT family N-acetyltransferase [Paeniroseomonas aquatica]
MSTNMQIRPASPDDRAEWLSLWQQYCAFYKVSLPQHVVFGTWQRIVTEGESINSLVAVGSNAKLLGFCNYVLHPNTWSDQTVCYLEDLFVHDAARRLGVGTKLINELTTLGRQENWFRIYWITNSDNQEARAAYDRLAKRTEHVRYEIAL